MLAFLTTPKIPSYELLTHELVSCLRSLGLVTVVAESTAYVNALVGQGLDPTDAMGEVLDARVTTIAECDLLIAVLDGAHPDVLVDIGLAFARGTDCYGLQVYGETPTGLHVSMLDGQVRSITDLAVLLRRHLRLDPANDEHEMADAR